MIMRIQSVISQLKKPVLLNPQLITQAMIMCYNRPIDWLISRAFLTHQKSTNSHKYVSLVIICLIHWHIMGNSWIGRLPRRNCEPQEEDPLSQEVRGVSEVTGNQVHVSMRKKRRIWLETSRIQESLSTPICTPRQSTLLNHLDSGLNLLNRMLLCLRIHFGMELS